MTKIKICGIRREQDIGYVNEFLPDYIGFIFAEGKRRTVSPEQAKGLKSRLNPNIQAVGVFLNNDIEMVIQTANEGIVDLIQLHGDEDGQYIAELRNRTVAPIIRAVRVRSAEDILQAEKLDVDYLLLDTYTQGAYGGTGKTFDWTMIPKISKPFFLAGGLTIENIKQAESFGAYCFDVSSGVETDGVKDKKKIQELIHLVRSE